MNVTVTAQLATPAQASRRPATSATRSRGRGIARRSESSTDRWPSSMNSTSISAATDCSAAAAAERPTQARTSVCPAWTAPSSHPAMAGVDQGPARSIVAGSASRAMAASVSSHHSRPETPNRSVRSPAAPTGVSTSRVAATGAGTPRRCIASAVGASSRYNRPAHSSGSESGAVQRTSASSTRTSVAASTNPTGPPGRRRRGDSGDDRGAGTVKSARAFAQPLEGGQRLTDELVPGEVTTGGEATEESPGAEDVGFGRVRFVRRRVLRRRHRTAGVSFGLQTLVHDRWSRVRPAGHLPELVDAGAVVIVLVVQGVRAVEVGQRNETNRQPACRTICRATKPVIRGSDGAFGRFNRSRCVPS